MFGCIQLLEKYLWKCLETNDVQTNKKLTGWAHPLLWMQCIIQCLGAVYFMNKSGINEGHVTLLFTLTVYYIYQVFRDIRQHEQTVIGPNGHLICMKGMSTMQGVMYFMGLMLPLLLTSSTSKHLLMFGAATALLCYHNYGKTGEFSSMWCLVAVLYPLVATLQIR